MTKHPAATMALLRAMLDLRIEFDILTEKVAKAAGLNPRDLGILDVLNAEGPRTPTELAYRTGIHAATLTAILIRLERAARVTRQPHPHDKRSTQVAISPATVRELDGHYGDVNLALHIRLEKLAPTTQLTITEFLKDVGAIARAGGP
ncbi:MAG: MarR family transcriptional regulator [Lapillicoccus sp.]